MSFLPGAATALGFAPRLPAGGSPAIPATAIYDDQLAGYVSDELLGGDYILEDI